MLVYTETVLVRGSYGGARRRVPERRQKGKGTGKREREVEEGEMVEENDG